MQKVTVDKTDLLRKVRENRQKHLNEHKESFDLWQKQMAKKLRELAESVETGTSPNLVTEVSSLPEPRSHLRDYDRIVTMLEMSTSDTIELTQAEFSQYAMDEWHWRDEFVATSAFYKAIHH